MATYHVIYNPKANNGRGEQEAKALHGIMDTHELKFYDASKIVSYSEFLASIPAHEELILAGGDGTLNYFVNHTTCEDRKRAIHYYAAGSGNDFLNDIEGKKGTAPIQINEYLENLPKVTVKGKTYQFINGIGYGIDGYCCEEGDRLREISDKPINYTSIAIKGMLFHFKPVNAKITVDGKEYHFKKAWLAPIMHGRYYGGGMMPTPDQDRKGEEKTLSVMVMHGAGKLGTLMAFPTIFKGEHVKKTKIVSVFTGKEIKVEFDRPTALQIDGETIVDVSFCEARSAAI